MCCGRVPTSSTSSASEAAKGQGLCTPVRVRDTTAAGASVSAAVGGALDAEEATLDRLTADAPPAAPAR